MARITIPPVKLRTTSEGGPGYPLGVAAGTGLTAPLALEALIREALAMAEVAAAPLEDAPGDYIDAASWGLEVIDVRLTPGPGSTESGGWLAYGTLRTTGLSPLIPPDEAMHGQ